MTAGVPALPLEIDPLIAEAKRRARRRRVLLLVAAGLLAASAAGIELAGSGSSGSSGAVPWLPTKPNLGSAHPPLAPACTASQLRASLTLKAEPGQFNANVLGTPVTSVALNGTLRIVAFNGTKAWPSAAYIGVQQGPNRNNSVQVLAIRNRETDDYLVVGYRLVVDGKEAKVASIENVAVAATVRVTIVFKNGVATISVNDGGPTEVHTPFREVAPYVSVSSGEAEFTINP